MKALRALALLLIIASVARPADVATLSGKKLTGDVISVDAKALLVKVAGMEQSVPVNDLVMVDLGNTPRELGDTRYVAVELTDGSLFHCSEFKIEGKNTTLTLLAPKGAKGVQFQVPNSSLYYIARDAQDAKNRLDFQTLLSKRGKRDMLIRQINNSLDGVEGTFGDGSADGTTVEFETASGQKLTPFQRSAHGMIFNQLPQGEKPPTVCKVIDVYKNELYAKSVAVRPQGLTVTTVGGVTIDYPDLGEVSKLDFSSGVLRYLSDVEPLKCDENSSTGFVEHYGRDHNLDNEKIRLDGVTYPKGLTVHAQAAITFDIGGDYKDFRTILGVDDTAGPDSAVKVRVEGDGRELYKGLVRRKERPRPLAVDVRGVKQLRLTVESEGEFDIANQVTFADAKVTK